MILTYFDKLCIVTFTHRIPEIYGTSLMLKSLAALIFQARFLGPVLCAKPVQISHLPPALLRHTHQRTASISRL